MFFLYATIDSIQILARGLIVGFKSVPNKKETLHKDLKFAIGYYRMIKNSQ
jgi:hypothetical protein